MANQPGDKPNIMVLQIGSGIESFRSTMEILRRMRDWPAIPHLLTGNRVDVVRALEYNKPQMIVLGSLEVYGTEGVVPFLREVKKANPLCKVVWLSSFTPPHGCEFDRIVSKNFGSYPEVVYRLMQMFSAGQPWPQQVEATPPADPYAKDATPAPATAAAA